MSDIERIRRVVTGMIETAQHEIDSFTVKFAADPAYALEWSAEAFTQAANRHAAECVLHWVEGSSYEVIKKELIDIITRNARYPERSTSQPSNLIKTEILAAYAKILDRIS